MSVSITHLKKQKCELKCALILELNFSLIRVFLIEE